jgi:hypothetical protein
MVLQQGDETTQPLITKVNAAPNDRAIEAVRAANP